MKGGKKPRDKRSRRKKSERVIAERHRGVEKCSGSGKEDILMKRKPSDPPLVEKSPGAKRKLTRTTQVFTAERPGLRRSPRFSKATSEPTYTDASTPTPTPTPTASVTEVTPIHTARRPTSPKSTSTYAGSTTASASTVTSPTATSIPIYTLPAPSFSTPSNCPSGLGSIIEPTTATTPTTTVSSSLTSSQTGTQALTEGATTASSDIIAATSAFSIPPSTSMGLTGKKRALPSASISTTWPPATSSPVGRIYVTQSASIANGFPRRIVQSPTSSSAAVALPISACSGPKRVRFSPATSSTAVAMSANSTSIPSLRLGSLARMYPVSLRATPACSSALKAASAPPTGITSMVQGVPGSGAPTRSSSTGPNVADSRQLNSSNQIPSLARNDIGNSIPKAVPSISPRYAVVSVPPSAFQGHPLAGENPRPPMGLRASLSAANTVTTFPIPMFSLAMQHPRFMTFGNAYPNAAISASYPLMMGLPSHVVSTGASTTSTALPNTFNRPSLKSISSTSTTTHGLPPSSTSTYSLHASVGREIPGVWAGTSSTRTKAPSKAKPAPFPVSVLRVMRDPNVGPFVVQWPVTPPNLDIDEEAPSAIQGRDLEIIENGGAAVTSASTQRTIAVGVTRAAQTDSEMTELCRRCNGELSTMSTMEQRRQRPDVGQQETAEAERPSDRMAIPPERSLYWCSRCGQDLIGHLEVEGHKMVCPALCRTLNGTHISNFILRKASVSTQTTSTGIDIPLYSFPGISSGVSILPDDGISPPISTPIILNSTTPRNLRNFNHDPTLKSSLNMVNSITTTNSGVSANTLCPSVPTMLHPSTPVLQRSIPYRHTMANPWIPPVTATQGGFRAGCPTASPPSMPFIYSNTATNLMTCPISSPSVRVKPNPSPTAPINPTRVKCILKSTEVVTVTKRNTTPEGDQGGGSASSGPSAPITAATLPRAITSTATSVTPNSSSVVPNSSARIDLYSNKLPTCTLPARNGIPNDGVILAMSTTQQGQRNGTPRSGVEDLGNNNK